MDFKTLIAAAAILARGPASVAGFGVGSILTPLLAVRVGTKLAVAAVSVPHLIATAVCFVLIRRHLDKRVLRKIPELLFRGVISFFILALGISLLIHPGKE